MGFKNAVAALESISGDGFCSFGADENGNFLVSFEPLVTSRSSSFERYFFPSRKKNGLMIVRLYTFQ